MGGQPRRWRREQRRRAAGELAAPPADLGTAADRSAELMRRTARGDRGAFAELYDDLAPRVYGVVRRVLRDPTTSEEVTQEVFLELWQKAPRFDAAVGTATAWAVTVAHRRAVDRVRSEEARGARGDRAARRDVEAAVDVVAERTEARLDAEQVRRALEGLTELQREAVTLAYYGGYTYQEVATLLHAPLGTVKTRIRDGLVRLRDTMGVTG